MTRVKVCGLTTERDAELAAAAGAAAVGMVFWPRSPRAVTVDQARRIVRALPPLVQVVGVFVNATPAETAAIADVVGLDVLQLHGDEVVEEWAGTSRPIMKALTLTTYTDSPWLDRARAVLLDAYDPVRRGGTGEAIDWADARRRAGGRPFVLAGGLTADNVAQAIDEARPDAVDVSSGVEAEPGRKDPARLRAFFDAVRRADDRARHTSGAMKEQA